MLDQLLKLAEGPLQEMLEGMNQDKASASAIKDSLTNSLQKRVSSGDTDAIMEMFSGKETSPGAPVINSLQGDVSQNLMDKLGISKEQAMGIAAAALPMIMNFFNKRVNDAPQDNNDIMSSIVSSLQGGQGKVGTSDLLGSLLGGGGKGGMDLGGLMDMGKGLFK
ncbi:DUF937 domain-containing protein [Algoriphagus winogradskyi]|uniref:DUF937 domain-containing protein n=1 Tax=Algoriphagus winogradskyi TaxID=237017 RepID=A0ABY1PFL7_9BACT|nr:DUF937 domain-containing protein [Algoriphagus winogradskyi]SMP33159.1 hypothetical protein SAMN06265367_108126 [Algoriphagus winogradskyi]